MKTVNGNDLTIEDLCAVACENEKVQLPEDKKFWETLERSRKFLEDYVATGVPVYGVTTDFGDSCNNQISVDKAGELQRTICTYHGIGVGPKFDHTTGRAVVLARLNSNVKGGHSAIRPELAKMLVNLLNKGESTVFLANRLTDFVTIRSIFPARASWIMLLKPSLSFMQVPLIPSSEYIPAKIQSLLPFM